MNLQSIIEKKITDSVAPNFLNVENESANHAVPKDSQTHFKVTVASDYFDGMLLLARHRCINKILAEELSGPIHALAIHTYTSSEWLKRNKMSQDSPQCLSKIKQ